MVFLAKHLPENLMVNKRNACRTRAGSAYIERLNLTSLGTEICLLARKMRGMQKDDEDG